MKSKFPGVEFLEINKIHDSRGWLMECFRADQINPGNMPAMAYISMTLPGVMRGPHEHKQQSDLFVFVSGSWELHLWDQSETHEVFQIDTFASVIIPPGIIHAYKNNGTELGMVLNCPNALYAGWDKKEPVDEIRHEYNPIYQKYFQQVAPK